MTNEETTLQDMIVRTVALLRENKALSVTANGTQRLYAADLVVRRSDFAPFFAAAGITKGSQIYKVIKPNTHDLPTLLTTIMRHHKIAYFHRSSIVPSKESVLEQIQNGTWNALVNWTKSEFSAALSTIRSFYYDSIGCNTPRLKAKTDVVSTQTKELLDPALDITKLLHKADLNGMCKDAVALAVHIRKLDEDPAYQTWLKRNHRAVIEAFILNGQSRAKLSQCHGINYTDPDREGCSTTMEDRDSSCIGDITHAELNSMATAYQDRLRRLIDYMTLPTYTEELEGGEYPLTTETEYLTHKEKMNTDNIPVTVVGGLTAASLPSEVLNLAKRLSAKHGPVRITNEASGIQIYIPDPELLITDGRTELDKKHLSVNAEKYLGIGRYDVDKYPTAENKQLYKKYRQHGKEVPSASSMKTSKLYSVEQLLAMPPIERRGLNLGEVRRAVVSSNTDKHLVYDENGNLVPEWCGDVVPLSSLPPDHPARDYMERQRHYNLDDLENKWDIGYCQQALPEDRGRGRYYSRLPRGCKNSPTGRIIIPIYDDEHVRRGWQARIIDFTNTHGDKWVWTDKQEWLQVAKNGENLFVSQDWPKGFDAHKYLNARGSQRNSLLFGLHQAVEFNKTRPFEKRYCVLVEGPLDAVRGGFPCIALLGKSMSTEQAALIRKHFAVVCTVMDQDKAGQECLRRIYLRLPGMAIKELTVPAGKKDLGDCTEEEARALVTKYDPLNE